MISFKITWAVCTCHPSPWAASCLEAPSSPEVPCLEVPFLEVPFLEAPFQVAPCPEDPFLDASQVAYPVDAFLEAFQAAFPEASFQAAFPEASLEAPFQEALAFPAAPWEGLPYWMEVEWRPRGVCPACPT